MLPGNSVGVFEASSESDGPRTTPGQSVMTSDASIVACDDWERRMCKKTQHIRQRLRVSGNGDYRTSAVPSLDIGELRCTLVE